MGVGDVAARTDTVAENTLAGSSKGEPTAPPALHRVLHRIKVPLPVPMLQVARGTRATSGNS